MNHAKIGTPRRQSATLIKVKAVMPYTRALAQRARRLHDAIRDAPREVVLKERPALPHDVPVALPANEARRAGNQCVVAYRHVDEDGERPHDEHEPQHSGEHGQLGEERLLALRRLHERDEPADE
jgi:hypothetical protein